MQRSRGRTAGKLQLAAGLFLLLTAMLSPAAQAEATFTLQESPHDTRVFDVEATVRVKGTLEAALGGGKSVKLDLQAQAAIASQERRLTGTGRDALALRALRSYEQARSEITVDKQTTFSRLAGGGRLIVAQGQREGVLLYPLEGSLRSGELELLRMPGDPLALLGLLPRAAVAVGESWSPDDWALQMLTGTDAVLKSRLDCRLESVRDGHALVSFRGEIDGAIDGAATTIAVEGTFTFDPKAGHLRELHLQQTEQRSVSAVSPGMDVTAEVKLLRTPRADEGRLGAAAAARVPLEPSPEQLLLIVDTPWNVRFRVNRRWRMFHQTESQTILRLLDQGSLVAQCNLSRIRPAEPGGHTLPADFQRDIAESLGERLRKFSGGEVLQTGDGRYVFRVVAEGEALGVPMHWIYYLCAAADGRQTSLVFTVESKLLERLGGADREIVVGLEFLKPARPPEPADR